MAYDVFISYRRQGGGADARMMYDRLQSYGYTVSFDMDTLKNGNFNEELLKRVAECKNFVVLLSENCFERTLNGCKREDDWLRIEIATALYNNKNVVTVMLPGFTFPEKLPPDIDGIRNKNGPKYDLYYIDGFYDKLKKDFLVKEESSNASSVSKLEAVFSTPEVEESKDGDILDTIGDDTDFLRQEAWQKYSAISRLLPYEELENIDGVWSDAESKKKEGDYKESGKLYLKVMSLCASATPCSAAFAMRMMADEIDTRRRDWFEKALARAQGGDVDYEYGVGCIYAGGLGVARDAASAFRWFDRSARHGNLSAMAAVGAAYSTGSGVETDYHAAVEWLTKAAQEGLPVAEERLGYLYQNGFGVDRDLCAAKEWYEKAANLGNSSARAALGLMYKNGVGVEKDEEQALSWFREAAADDHPMSLRVLAETIFASDQSPNYDEALGYCRRAVNAGDVEAICVLGGAYEKGAGVAKDLKKAGELYQKAKSLGSERADELLKELEPETQYQLGLKYMEGRGVDQDFSRARAWLLRAADQGHVEAMAWYGHLLGSGLGGEVDMGSAIKLFEKAADAGSAVALIKLGGLYKSGTVFKEDKEKAMRCFEKAAGLWKDAPRESRWFAVGAFNRMAIMYKKGEACNKDSLLAARLYRFAAVSGSISACRSLGIFYRDGIGVEKSAEEMERWFAEMWRLSKAALHPCDGSAMYSLGEACQSGQGCQRDLMAAADWWHRGMAQADFNCAVDLSNAGRQHPEILLPGDMEAVINQYKREADAGGRVAMNNLGVRYRYGRGVKADSAAAAEWYRKAAALGYGTSMLRLGEMYETGDGVEQDKELGLRWIQKAAEADDQDAQRKLAARYKGGTSLGRDFAKSKEWLEKVLEKEPEDISAARQLGIAYRDGLGVEEDATRANELFASVLGKLCRLAEDQKAGSQDDLADCYYRGYGIPVDCKKASELYEKAALGKNEHAMDQLRRFFRYGIIGDPDIAKSDEWARVYLAEKTKEGGDAARGLPGACLNVGDHYRYGYGVAPDPKVALSWYEKAAAKKSWSAMMNIARMLSAGDEIAKDEEAATEWAVKAVAELKPLAENGLAEAQRALADCYATGLGVEKSTEKAGKYYAEAYEGRDWLAAARLARYYASGEGVDRDEKKSLTLLQKAADRNSGEALGLLGQCYENAELGLQGDCNKAFELYRRAASEGNVCGMYNVGRCYENGIGVQRDREKAILWLRTAVSEKGDFWGCSAKAAELLATLEVSTKKEKKNVLRGHGPSKVSKNGRQKGVRHA